MPRVKITEEFLTRQLDKLNEKKKAVKKKLQELRIREATAKRKSLFKSIRKNEKEVLELLKTKAPEFFDKLSLDRPKRGRPAGKNTGKKRGRPPGVKKAA